MPSPQKNRGRSPADNPRFDADRLYQSIRDIDAALQNGNRQPADDAQAPINADFDDIVGLLPQTLQETRVPPPAEET